MITPRNVQRIKDADASVAQGDYLQAIGLYEATLDGTAASADTHYKLGLLYDDKLSDPLNALHHFKRYVALAPEGAHAERSPRIHQARRNDSLDQFVRRFARHAR